MRHQYYELSSDSLDLCKGKLTPGITATWGEIAGNIETQKDLVSYISAHGTAAWGSISGSITDQTDLIEYTDRFATTAWVQEQGYLTSASLSGYATESWVSSQGYLPMHTRYGTDRRMDFIPNIPEIIMGTSSTLGNIGASNITLGASEYGIHLNSGGIRYYRRSPATERAGISAAISGTSKYPEVYLMVGGSEWTTEFYDDRFHTYYNSSGVHSEIEIPYVDIISKSDLSQYATRQWVTGRGYITTSALSGYATESWVSSQGYITSSSLSGYIHFDESSPLSSIGKTLPFYSSTVGLFPVYQSYSSAWVNIEMTTNPVGWVSMALACYTEDGSSEIWRNNFITENDMTGYVSRSYVDWRLVQEEGYPLSIYTPADENGNYTIGSLDDTTHAFTGIKVSGSQVGAYTVISSGLQYQESFSSFVTQSWVSSQGYLNESSAAIQSLAARLSALESNYGDALSITNNILS